MGLLNFFKKGEIRGETPATADDAAAWREGSAVGTGDTAARTEPPAVPAPEEPADIDDLHKRIVMMLRTVFDPEIPVNIYDLGLIYRVDIDDARAVHVKMTLTAPNCPAAGTLPGEVEAKVRGVAGVTDVQLELVWEPTWNKDMMSEVARLELGM